MTRAVIDTRYGRVRGGWQNGVQVFRGIPYGAPTGGENRFLPPSPMPSWSGVRDAIQFGPYSPQDVAAPMWCDPRFGAYFTGGRAAELIEADIRAGEDCLVLNVLTPRAEPTAARPVMVYLHGGGFRSMCGSIATLADTFVREQDVVLVSINHRLNAFGFLYLGGMSERYATGNVGLLDLVAALGWVRDNITAFGGDPDNVTVFGESGGGSKILDLMAMESARGLFHRAIVQCSGWPDPLSTDAATENAAAVLARLDIGNDLSRLAGVPTEAIVAALGAAPRNGLCPVLDGLTITTSPWQDSAPAMSAHIPMIVGNCRDEMTTHISDPAQLDLGWAELVPLLAKYTCLDPDLLEPVVEVYRNHRPDASPGDLYIAIGSGRLREIGLRVAEQQSDQQSAVYRYDFTYQPPMDDKHLRAFHTADGPLALRLVRYPESDEVSRRISAAWGNFARTGDPNHAELPTWLPYRDNRATMIFDRESLLVHDPQPAERVAMAELPHLGSVPPRT